MSTKKNWKILRRDELKEVERSEGGEREVITKRSESPSLSLSLPLKHLKGLRLSCLLMAPRYDNGDTKPVYSERAGCSQVGAV